MREIQKSDTEWQQQLTAEQFKVCRQKGTEMAFSGHYYNCHAQGIYQCVCCGHELFSSDTKYDSGSGWPSFYAPLNAEAVETEADNSLGMRRVEVHCPQCGAHLGHVFEDGPAPTGLRYCINSVALDLKPESN